MRRIYVYSNLVENRP